MSLSYPTAISVTPSGGSLTDLSDHGRSPVVETREERAVDVELANGSIRKYVKAVKHTWSMEWVWLPDQDSDTVDGKAGRETMRGMFSVSNSGQPFTLTFRDRASTGGTTTRTYTVFVASYSDDLIRRDVASGKYFFDCKVSFREQ